MGEWKVNFGEFGCSSSVVVVETCFCNNIFMVLTSIFFDLLGLGNWSPLPGEYYGGVETLSWALRVNNHFCCA